MRKCGSPLRYATNAFLIAAAATAQGASQATFQGCYYLKLTLIVVLDIPVTGLVLSPDKKLALEKILETILLDLKITQQ